MLMKPCAILVLSIFLMSAATGQAASGPEIVTRHAITLNAPAGEPTQYMPSGPLLGNGGAIGLDSDRKLIEISHNMINAMGRWRDYNVSSSWYAACARVGYDPQKILAGLNNMYANHALPNKLLSFGGGGIENVSPALGVTEMLLQSHEGVIRFFPCWPKDQDARFGTLRARGAFLVSAELKNGIVSGVNVTSEKGGDCAI